MAISLEEMYEKYTILSNAKDKIDAHTKEYIECIKGTESGPKEKKLAAQIIQKFYKHFPDLQEAALNAILDLCEDSDSQICICAMKFLPLMCQDVKENITTVASVLAQLLQLEEVFTTACSCLTQIFRQDAFNTVRGLFFAIHESGDKQWHEKVIGFLFNKLIKTQEKLTTELEDLLIEKSKKIIPMSTATEFMGLMPFLISSKLGKTKAGQEELVNLAAERAELDSDFDPLETGNNNTDRIIMCTDCVLSLFSASLESTKFVKYYCDQILPQWKAIENVENGKTLQYLLLKQLAELSTHCGKLEDPSKEVSEVFSVLKNYMPAPPENADIADMPNLDFTAVECLLYTFHRLARQCPDFLTVNPDVLKDFRLRLQYFQRGVQGSKRSLDKTLSSKTALSSEDEKKVKLAPAILDNIISLIKDLFYTPPVFKCNVNLSFKALEKQAKTSNTEPVSPTQKRHKPITFESNNDAPSSKQSKSSRGADSMKLYTVPSGKYSNNFSKSSPRGGRGRGGSRGSWSRGGGNRRF